jgi:hypothetical protein
MSCLSDLFEPHSKLPQDIRFGNILFVKEQLCYYFAAAAERLSSTYD